MGVEFVSFRSEEKLRKNAEDLARLERRSKSDEYREIFAVGISEKRKQVSLDQYSKGAVSFGKAVEISGLNVWEFVDLLRQRNVPVNLSAKDILAQAGGV